MVGRKVGYTLFKIKEEVEHASPINSRLASKGACLNLKKRYVKKKIKLNTNTHTYT
jgi:hypothetical protein